MKKKITDFFNEFKTFALRGNILDLAVGIIIGAAFTSIVSALTDSVLIPLLGLIIGGINIKTLQVSIGSLWSNTEGVVIKYGEFIQSVINFIFIAFCLFILVRFINRIRSKDDTPPPAPEPDKTHILLEEIRDLLAEQNKNK